MIALLNVPIAARGTPMIDGPKAGQVLYAVPLDNAPTLPVYLAAGWSAFGDLANAIVAKDKVGIDDLIARRLVIPIEHGTPMLVLETDKTGSKLVPTEVRVQDGKYKNVKGFVSALCLDDKPPRPPTKRTKRK